MDSIIRVAPAISRMAIRIHVERKSDEKRFLLLRGNRLLFAVRVKVLHGSFPALLFG